MTIASDDDAALDRLLDAWIAPPPPDDLAARATAEAIRSDRPRLPPPVSPRRRAWTRRGIWTGVVAFNLVLASAVAAAFGGGPLAPFRQAAARVIEHIVHRTSPHPHPHHAARPRPALTAPRFVAQPRPGPPDRPAAPMRFAPRFRLPDRPSVIAVPRLPRPHAAAIRHRPEHWHRRVAHQPAWRSPHRIGPAPARERWQFAPRRFERPAPMLRPDWRGDGAGWRRGRRFGGPRFGGGWRPRRRF